MADLLVPQRIPDPFRDHYRALVLGSVLRAAETETERHRARGHRRRARRAEETAAQLRLLTAALPPTATVPRAAAIEVAPATTIPARGVGGALRAWIGIGWVAALALFALSLAVAGIDSWTTTVTDVALIVLTFAWFWVWSGDPEPLDEARRGRLDPSR
jgi:hypothetical protein